MICFCFWEAKQKHEAGTAVVDGAREAEPGRGRRDPTPCRPWHRGPGKLGQPAFVSPRAPAAVPSRRQGPRHFTDPRGLPGLWPLRRAVRVSYGESETWNSPAAPSGPSGACPACNGAAAGGLPETLRPRWQVQLRFRSEAPRARSPPSAWRVAVPRGPWSRLRFSAQGPLGQLRLGGLCSGPRTQPAARAPREGLPRGNKAQAGAACPSRLPATEVHPSLRRHL